MGRHALNVSLKMGAKAGARLHHRLYVPARNAALRFGIAGVVALILCNGGREDNDEISKKTNEKQDLLLIDMYTQ
jgi:hypothetical protein